MVLRQLNLIKIFSLTKKVWSIYYKAPISRETSVSSVKRAQFLLIYFKFSLKNRDLLV